MTKPQRKHWKIDQMTLIPISFPVPTGCYSEDCVFSIIYGDAYESLDLVASTADEANFWVTGLSMLVAARRAGQTGPKGPGEVVAANLDERQLMREKWLEECFRQADTDRYVDWYSLIKIGNFLKISRGNFR